MHCYLSNNQEHALFTKYGHWKGEAELHIVLFWLLQWGPCDVCMCVNHTQKNIHTHTYICSPNWLLLKQRREIFLTGKSFKLCYREKRSKETHCSVKYQNLIKSGFHVLWYPFNSKKIKSHSSQGMLQKWASWFRPKRVVLKVVLRQVLEDVLGHRVLLPYTYIQGFQICTEGEELVIVCESLRLSFCLYTTH